MSEALERSRQRLEAELGELHGALESEFAWKPRLSRWALPLVAVAVGLLAGVALRRNLPRLGRGG